MNQLPTASHAAIHPRSTTALVTLATALAITLGCSGRPLVNASDPEAAVALVDASFQAWKNGRSLDDLRRDSPPVYVAEDLWKAGFRLIDYSIDGSGELFGTNVRVAVTLKGTDPKGKPLARQLTYLVTTTPAMTIAREDR